MASVTANVAQVFPVGTSVGAYPASGWPASALPPSGAAVPSATESQTVAADGTVTFTTLAAGTRYFLGANLTPWRYTQLVTPGGSASPRGSASDPLSTTDDTELPAAAALADATPNPTAPAVAGDLMVFNGTTWDRLRSASAIKNALNTTPALGAALYFDDSGNWRPWNPASLVGDGDGGNSIGVVSPRVYNGLNNDRMRTPNVFKSLATTAITAGTGATIWTPAGGKKFRVMGISYSTSVAGQLLLGDNVVGTVIARSPSLAAGGVWQLGAADMGNGILSAAANNVLKMDGPTGNIMGMVWGTEE